MLAVTRRVAEFAANLTFDSLPEDVVGRAIDSVRDILGIAIAAANEPVVDAMITVARTMDSSSTCGLPGRSDRLSPFWAAATWGTAAHSLELDDGHRGGHVHPGVTILPALLADAEARGASGSAVLTAYAVGAELSVRIGKAISPHAQYVRGFHIPGLVGTLGSIAAVGRLRGLGPAAIEAAMGNAVLGPVAPFLAFSSGAAAKDLYGGWPAAMGILANDLAAAGVRGPAGLLEAPMGWLEVVGASAEGFDSHDFGERWLMLESYVKLHAACSLSHTAIDSALDARATGLDVGAIASVEVATHVFADRLDNRRPATPQAAKFSIPWMVAAALSRGHVDIEASTLASLSDSSLQDLAARVTVIEDAEFTRRHLEDDTVRPTRVTVTLNDGSVLARQRDNGRGGPEDPVTAGDLRRKFDGLVGGSGIDGGRVWEACGQLGGAPDVRDLSTALQGCAG